METQQRLILDNLTLGQPPEASRPQTSPMPWDSMQLGDHNLSQSVSLSSFSGHSGGVPGGTVARPGSPSSLPMSSANNNSRSDSTQEKELPIPPQMLSRKDLILHEDQLQESAGYVSDRELDAALQSAMQVMEDLLQNAATQACVKAAATLRVRLQTLLSRQGESRDSEAEEAPPKTPPEDPPDVAPGPRLMNVKQRWIGEVPHRAALRPRAPAHPRLLSLGDVPSQL